MLRGGGGECQCAIGTEKTPESLILEALSVEVGEEEHAKNVLSARNRVFCSVSDSEALP
jgi:hypothetical protein